jgi:hypothetical protein
MKNIKFISPILVALSLLVASCSSDGNGNLPDLERVPIPLMTQVPNSDVLIQDPAEFNGKFTIDLLFKEDVAPKQIDIVVTKNGDYSVSKVLQAGVTTFPSTIDIDTKKLADLFGIPVSQVTPGDYFEIGANIITQSGLTVPAFNKIGNQFSADIANIPGASLSLKYPVVCPLDLDLFVGEFTVYDPNFWEGNYPVTVTREGENTLVITGFVEDPASVVKIVVDPRTTKTSVASQVIVPSIWGYSNLKVVGGGEINACQNSVVLNLSYSVDQGSFGTFALTIKK